jgi:energy-coupling factor transport system permease protein
MTASAASTPLLRKLDPRLKLVLLPLLIAATFSADSVLRLLLLSGTALWLSRSRGEPLQLWWQIIRPLRFLLLVTLLMHLGFSPGRTLFGQTWLSLDGLQLGLLTCWRLIVAVTFAVLLTRTTSAEHLAAALGALLSPLKRIGVKVDALTEFLFLTLYFIPLLQDEAGVQLKADPAAPRAASLRERLRGSVAKIEPLILGFADRADAMALRLSRGEEVVAMPQLGALQSMPGGWFSAVGGVLFFLVVFSL